MRLRSTQIQIQNLCYYLNNDQTRLSQFYHITTLSSNLFPEEDNLYRAVFSFLEELSTIALIVKGFSVVQPYTPGSRGAS